MTFYTIQTKYFLKPHPVSTDSMTTHPSPTQTHQAHHMAFWVSHSLLCLVYTQDCHCWDQSRLTSLTQENLRWWQLRRVCQLPPWATWLWLRSSTLASPFSRCCLCWCWWTWWQLHLLNALSPTHNSTSFSFLSLEPACFKSGRSQLCEPSIW